MSELILFFPQNLKRNITSQINSRQVMLALLEVGAVDEKWKSASQPQVNAGEGLAPRILHCAGICISQRQRCLWICTCNSAWLESCSSKMQAGPPFLWKLSQGFLLSVVVSPGAAWNSGSAWRGEGTRAAPGATAWTIWRMWGQREQELPLLHSLNNLEHLAHRSASLAVQFPMHCRCQATTLSLPQWHRHWTQILHNWNLSQLIFLSGISLQAWTYWHFPILRNTLAAISKINLHKDKPAACLSSSSEQNDVSPLLKAVLLCCLAGKHHQHLKSSIKKRRGRILYL